MINHILVLHLEKWYRWPYLQNRSRNTDREQTYGHQGEKEGGGIHWEIEINTHMHCASQVALGVKNLPASTGDVIEVGSVPGFGRSPGGGHGDPLQYSCLENPTDKGAWWAAVHRVTKSWT